LDVAKQRSSQYPYQWADGSWHSQPQKTAASEQAWKAIDQYWGAQRNGTATPTMLEATRLLIDGKTPTEGPPPSGTYDPNLDYQSGAGNRGLTQTQNDAQTLFEQGQENLGLGLGDLTRGRDRNLADLTTGRDRTLGDMTTGRDRTLFDLQTNLERGVDDYNLGTWQNNRQYGILGRQQAESAAKRGITSPGLLGKSATVRAGNQALDQSLLNRQQTRLEQDVRTGQGRTNEDFTYGSNRVNEDFTRNSTRTNEDFDRGSLGLNLNNARTFGGFNGQVINNPLTGKPYTGSLATGTQRAFTENEAFQGGILGQKIGQAAAGGYVAPLTGTYQDMLRKIRGY
jgi:hypothetical protein